MRVDVKNSTVCERFGCQIRCVLAAAVLAWLAVSGTLHAQTRNAPDAPFVSGAEFRVMCTSNWGNPAYLEMYAACRAYVSAVADILAQGQVVASVRACFDEEVSKGRIVESVITWLRNHPGETELTATQLAASALARTYPCPFSPASGETGRDPSPVR
ncbi:MAG: Rap1a/Tai family immunity protein [Pseudomonadota bacterium]